MVRAGTGDPQHASRNKKERDRYQIVSGTIDQLKKKLRLNTRFHTQVLSQTLDELRRLKAENVIKTAEKNILLAGVGFELLEPPPQSHTNQLQPPPMVSALQTQLPGRIPTNTVIHTEVGYWLSHNPVCLGHNWDNSSNSINTLSPTGGPALLRQNYGYPQLPMNPLYMAQIPPQLVQQFIPGQAAHLPK